MFAAAQRQDDDPPAIVVITNDNWEDSQVRFKKKRHAYDFSHTIYSIIKNERVHDFMLGAGVGLAGMGLKAVFASAAHATGASALILLGAATVGFGKGLYTAWKNDWYKNDENKSVIKEVFKSTALATIGGAFAMFALPGIAEGFQHLTENFNLDGMLSGLGGLWPFGKPEIPAMPLVSAPPVQVAPPVVIDAPAEVTTDTSIETQVDTPIEVPAISEQWRAIEALAERGNAQAQKDMAMSFLSGINGFEADADRAMELYRQAAEAGNLQAQTDLKLIAERNYRGMGDAAKAILEQAAPAPEAIASSTVDIAAVAPFAGTELSMTFEIQADGSIGGFIHNAAGIVAPGTMFEVPVSQVVVAQIN